MKAIEAMRVKAVGQEGASFHFPSIVNKGIRSPKAQELTSLPVLYEAMENSWKTCFSNSLQLSNTPI